MLKFWITTIIIIIYIDTYKHNTTGSGVTITYMNKFLKFYPVVK